MVLPTTARALMDDGGKGAVPGLMAEDPSSEFSGKRGGAEHGDCPPSGSFAVGVVNNLKSVVPSQPVLQTFGKC